MKMNKKGISIIAAIFIMLALSLVIATVASLVATSGDVAINYWESLEAFYIAEAGWARARVRLGPTGDWAFEKKHKESRSIGAGTFTVETKYDKKRNTVTITSTGYVPDSSDPRARRRVVERNIFPPAPAITATASSETKKHPANDAIDEDLATYWQPKKEPHWLRLTFIKRVTFDKVIFYQDTVNIAEFHIEYYDYDVTDFVPVTNPVIDGPTEPNNMITVTFDQVESDQVQLVVDEPIKKKARPNISEFEVYLGGGKVELGGGGLGKGIFVESY